MEIRKIVTLRGPNVWAWVPVLEALVDLKELKDSPSDSLPGFNDRLMGWMPSMIEHRCSIGERGGFFERLRRGTYQGHILEHVTIELQRLAGCDVGMGKARETAEEGVYKVVIEFEDETLARAALDVAHRLCHAAVYDKPFDIAHEVKQLRELADNVCLGPSTRAIVNAAEARNIPYRRLNSGSLVQLGWGAKQRRILTAETDRTSAIAESIAQDKELTRRLLRAVGVPVPEGRPVSDVDDAWEAAEDIGVPVVIKPRDANHGRGVFTGLTTREQVCVAFAHAEHEGSGVLVERFIPGVEHRVLVVNGRVVAASRGAPAVIVGDGLRDVEQLIDEQLNSNPLRGEDCASLMYTIELDAATRFALEQQGYGPDSIPPRGTRILIKRNGNVDTDVTERVHPEVAARAVEAARVVGLDIAGLDIVVEDISHPLEPQRGAIVEVNAGPGLLMHVRPADGTPRPVGEAIIDGLFPAGEDGRIPVIAVTGTVGKTTTVKLLGAIIAAAGHSVGLATSEGIYRDGERLKTCDAAGYDGAQSLFLNPAIDCAVCEVSARSVVIEGLGFDECLVGVVTNVGQGDNVPLTGSETPEEIAKLKCDVVQSIPRNGFAVLNADEPLVADMAEKCRGGVILFARSGRNLLVSQHRRQGGRTVFLEPGKIVLAEGAGPKIEIPYAVADNSKEPSGLIESALAAAAGAWAIGISAEHIREGLARSEAVQAAS